MPIVIAMTLIGILAFAAFCFYCGVSTIGEKIKRDGFLSFLEWVIIVYVVTAFVMLLTSRVSGELFRSLPAEQSRIIQV